MKTFFKKLEYCFSVESTKIGNAIFRYNNNLSESNVKTNRMRSTKGIYHKEWSFACNHFTFLKTLCQFNPLSANITK